MAESVELTRIKGIGPARAAWFADTFGVRTASGLAALSPDTISSRLFHQPGPVVPRATIEAWVTEAASMNRQPDPSAGAVDEWVPVATFVVEFQAPAGSSVDGAGQTSLHHVEGDHTEAWSGIDVARLAHRIVDLLPAAPTGTTGPGPDTSGADGTPRVVALRAELDGGNQAGYQLLDADKDWSVVFEWSIGDCPIPPGGDWVVDALLVPVRPGHAVRLQAAPRYVPVDLESTEYRTRLPIDSACVAGLPLDTILRGTATVTYRPAGSDRSLLAAFADLGMISFWRAD